MNHYLYLDVKVIKSGKVGIVIDVNSDSVFIEFSDGSREWHYESDILEVNEE